MMTQKNSEATRDSDVFPALPFGCQLTGVYELFCEECEEPFFKRYFTTPPPGNWVLNERTPCKCVRDQQAAARESEVRAAADMERLGAQAQVDRLFRAWSLLEDERYDHMELGRFQVDEGNDKAVLKGAQGFGFDRSLCLSGFAGRGKTHIAVALARKAQKMGKTVLAIRSIDLLNRLRKCYESRDDAKEIDLMQALKRVEVLVIDDIGQEKTTAWVKEKLYDVIDFRDGRRCTIFTTNLDGNAMKETMGVGLTSRIYGAGISVEVAGRDHRLDRVANDPWLGLGKEVDLNGRDR